MIQTAQKIISIQDFMASCLALKIPFALWKKPGQEAVHLVAGWSLKSWTGFRDLEDLSEGFLMAPFDVEEKESIFIPADFKASFPLGNRGFERFSLNPRQEKQESCQAFLNMLNDGGDLKQSHKYHSESYSSAIEKSDPKTSFIQLVNDSISSIQQGFFQKVVPSRRISVALPDSFDGATFFLDLCHQYKDAFVALISSPQKGTWACASPETLIEMNHELGTFKTVALAGTQALPANTPLNQIPWTQKEIEEQALVSRYIINCFKKIRVREFEELGPRTIPAGNLAHLKTDFLVNSQEVGFPQIGSVMMRLLHPTSAVCGMPRVSAHQFLKKNEGYDRLFYAGFLGPIHQEHKSHLFVNLRCTHLGNKEATLFAGAGITIDSIPEKEWIETEMKANILLNVILTQA